VSFRHTQLPANQQNNPLACDVKKHDFKCDITLAERGPQIVLRVERKMKITPPAKNFHFETLDTWRRDDERYVLDKLAVFRTAPLSA
jgi:hypothetical protein